MNKLYILLLLFILILFFYKYNEPFSLGIIDPYSLKLHHDIAQKQLMWEYIHTTPFRYHWYYAS